MRKGVVRAQPNCHIKARHHASRWSRAPAVISPWPRCACGLLTGRKAPVRRLPIGPRVSGALPLDAGGKAPFGSAFSYLPHQRHSYPAYLLTKATPLLPVLPEYFPFARAQVTCIPGSAAACRRTSRHAIASPCSPSDLQRLPLGSCGGYVRVHREVPAATSSAIPKGSPSTVRDWVDPMSGSMARARLAACLPQRRLADPDLSPYQSTLSPSGAPRASAATFPVFSTYGILSPATSAEALAPGSAAAPCRRTLSPPCTC